MRVMDHPRVSLTACGYSDVGLVRENNEDSFLLLDLTTDTVPMPSTSLLLSVGGGFLFVVADGVGGHQAGEVASQMAVQTLRDSLYLHFRRPGRLSRQAVVTVLRKAIAHANMKIYTASQTGEQYSGMGTTLTAALLYDGAVFFAQIGDSRGYLMRSQHLVQMTKDQRLCLDEEEEEEGAPPKVTQTALLQALGIAPHVTIPVSYAEVHAGDWLLLCSDGLTDMVATSQVGALLGASNEPEENGKALIAAAKSNGGRDNITVVVAKILHSAPSRWCGNVIVQPHEFPIPRWRRWLPWTSRHNEL